jgi:hypothetical protein
MSPSRFLSIAAAATALAVTGSARGGGGAATDAYDDVGDDALEVHGLADLYMEGNFNRPPSGINQLRPFDEHTSEPSIGLLRLTLAHRPDAFGFRLDAGVGDLADAYLRFDPARTDYAGLSRGLSYLEQAFVSATVPIGRGLEVDVGKFGTPVGLEDNEALGNWNYSRSLLYLLAEPSFHAGLRLTYPVTPALGVSVFWVNGWDANLLDGNGMRAIAAAISWKPIPTLELVADDMAGPERAPTRLSDPTLAFRNELDAYARYEVAKRAAVAWTVDHGRDAADGGVSWWGVGGYVRVELDQCLSTSFRAEHYSDRDGFTSGTKQDLAEVTATLEARGTLDRLKWIARLEYRRDQSDVLFFTTGSEVRSSHQDTLGAALLAAF